MHSKMYTSKEIERARTPKSNLKAIAICFLYIKSLILVEWVHDRQTNNGKYCACMIISVKPVGKRSKERQIRWRNNSRILHPSSSAVHNAILVVHFVE